jgi:rhamnogalacturonyl hydrolase YesR
VGKSQSTKGMGVLATGFIRLHQATGDKAWAQRARAALDWLIDHQSAGYSGACWGNHFDYRCRSFYLPKGVPTVVWTSLIGHAFLDGFKYLGDEKYLQVADSACRHILRDLAAFEYGESQCITYVPGLRCEVHNSNVLGASLLARTHSFVGGESYRDLAQRAIRYTAERQRPDGSWYYGEKDNLHWVDNFHTAYVLDCFKCYAEATGDRGFEDVLAKGYKFWKRTFFLADGAPRYYDRKMLPIDIQCCSQAIDTLVYFQEPEGLELAVKVARWTIQHMQDRSGYFYYRRYSPWLVNKTPTLHWGQATMLSALAGLYQCYK